MWLQARGEKSSGVKIDRRRGRSDEKIRRAQSSLHPPREYEVPKIVPRMRITPFSRGLQDSAIGSR